jgi:hypothetical protein
MKRSKAYSLPKLSLVQVSHSFSTHIDAKFGSNRCKAIWRNIIKMIYFYGGAADARARCFVSIINFQFKVALGCFTYVSQAKSMRISLSGSRTALRRNSICEIASRTLKFTSLRARAQQQLVAEGSIFQIEIHFMSDSIAAAVSQAPNRETGGEN